MMAGAEGEEPVSGSSPEELKARIEKLKRPPKGDAQFARAVGLVASLGVAFIGVMYGSWVLGRMLDQHTGSTVYTPIALFAGVAAGGWMGYLLLRPLLKDE